MCLYYDHAKQGSSNVLSKSQDLELSTGSYYQDLELSTGPYSPILVQSSSYKLNCVTAIIIPILLSLLTFPYVTKLIAQHPNKQIRSSCLKLLILDKTVQPMHILYMLNRDPPNLTFHIMRGVFIAIALASQTVTLSLA